MAVLYAAAVVKLSMKDTIVKVVICITVLNAVYIGAILRLRRDMNVSSADIQFDGAALVTCPPMYAAVFPQ
jgi:hypothetical protein